jgi:hypothetical protein
MAYMANMAHMAVMAHIAFMADMADMAKPNIKLTTAPIDPLNCWVEQLKLN